LAVNLQGADLQDDALQNAYYNCKPNIGWLSLDAQGSLLTFVESEEDANT